MTMNRRYTQTDSTKRVTFLNDPLINPDTDLYFTLAQDNKGFQYQIALDVLPPGTTSDHLTQGNQWFVENKTGLWRPTVWGGTGQGLPTYSTTPYYISAYDTTDQTAASATTAYAMSLDTVAESNGITLGSSGEFYIQNTAIYNIQFSVQLANTGASVEDANIWLRTATSGTLLSSTSSNYDVAFSNGLVGIPAKHASTDGHNIAAWNYVMTISGGQYVQLWWQVESTAVSIQTLPAGTTPVIPVSPSVIATITQLIK